MSVDDWYEKLEKRMPDDWKEVLIGSKKRSKMLKEVLSNIVGDIDKLRPNPKEIFAFTKYISIKNIRAVILGQDPYPNKHACGIAFSSEERSEPQSWLPIKKALQAQNLLGDHIGADLRAWEMQGILLINTSLTTIEGAPKSHSSYWESYVNCILSHLVDKLDLRMGSKTVCWLLWGADAKSKSDIIKSSTYGTHKVLTWCHPSPQVSYNKDKDDPKNFIHCDHFSKVVKITSSEWDMPVNWRAISEDIECFTDGSTYPNRKCAEANSGYAVFFTKGPIAGLTIAGRIDNTEIFTTNIRAEGQAFISALQKLLELPDIWESATIFLDCEFYIKLVNEYLPAWKEKGTIDEKKNPDINKKIKKLLAELDSDGKKITLQHVRSHQDEPEDPVEHYKWEHNKYVDTVSGHVRVNFPLGVKIESFSFARDYL